MISNFDRATIGYDKMDEHDKDIWNTAIEAAALKSYELFDERDFAREVCADEIRRLKK